MLPTRRAPAHRRGAPIRTGALPSRRALSERIPNDLQQDRVR